MSGISEIYARQVHEHLKPLYANWMPGAPIKLGDYGKMVNGVFDCSGNIAQLGFLFTTREDDSIDSMDFSTSDSVDIAFYAKGKLNLNGVVNARPAVEINFKRGESVFFNAAGCRHLMIEDKAALGAELIKKRVKIGWDQDWVIVTSIVQSGATTVLISGSKNSKIVLEASADIPEINFAEASIGFNTLFSSDFSCKIVAEPGIVPLIGLSQLKIHVFSKPSFERKMMVFPDNSNKDKKDYSGILVENDKSDDSYCEFVDI
jgi:hypothetical protein